MSSKQISIVIPTYNKKRALSKTLRNLMGQLEEGDEVIVSDDGSTDNVKAMLEKHYPPVKFHSLGEHSGYRLNSVRNLGVERAVNPLIIILDADCIPQPPLVETFRSEIREGVYCGGCVAYRVPMKIQRRVARNGMAPAVYIRGDFPIEEVIDWVETGSKPVKGTTGGCMGFHKEDWKKVNGFSEVYNGKWGVEDSDFIIKLFYAGVKITNARTNPALRGAIAMHQDHKSDRKRFTFEMEENRLTCRNRLPLYRRGVFAL